MEEIELSLASSAASILQQDPLANLHGSEVTLSDLHRKHRDRAWEIIKDLVLDEARTPRVVIFIPGQRGPLIAARVIEKGVTKQTIYNYLRKY